MHSVAMAPMSCRNTAQHVPHSCPSSGARTIILQKHLGQDHCMVEPVRLSTDRQGRAVIKDCSWSSRWEGRSSSSIYGRSHHDLNRITQGDSVIITGCVSVRSHGTSSGVWDYSRWSSWRCPLVRYSPTKRWDPWFVCRARVGVFA